VFKGKELYFYSYLTTRNLLFRPIRSLLTVLGIGVACCVYLLMLHFAGGYQNSVLDMFSSRGIDLFIMERGKVDPLTSSLDESIVEMLRKVDVVSDSTGSLADVLSLEDGTNVIVIGYEPDSFYYDGMIFLDGRKPLAAGEVSVGQSISDNLGLTVGDIFDLEFESFTVSGIFQADNLFETNAVVMDIDMLRGMRGVGKVYSSVGVRLKETYDGDHGFRSVESNLTEKYPNARVSLSADFLKDSRMLQSVRQLVSLISLLAFGLVLMSCMNTLGTSVFERTREIGMLRAIGWGGPGIIIMVLGEALLLCLAGWVLGAVIASISAQYLAGSGRLLFVVSGQISARILIRAAVFCLVGGLIGAVQPAIKAVKMEPAEAYSHE
jgi:putative ABC transport system permease protein